MSIKSTVAGVLFSIAAGTTIAAAPPAYAATAYLDAGAWLGAAAGLGPVQLIPMRLHSPVMSDAFGSYTDASVPVLVPDPDNTADPTALAYRTRSAIGAGPASLGPEQIVVGFGCYSPVFPCLGAQTFEAAFERPVLGFGGLFEWHMGDPAIAVPMDINGLRLDWNSPFPPSDAGLANLRTGFLGFIGPMDTLSLRWLGGNTDDTAWVRWAAPFAIVAVTVPEPATFGLLAAALFGLCALGAPRPGPSRARR